VSTIFKLVLLMIAAGVALIGANAQNLSSQGGLVKRELLNFTVKTAEMRGLILRHKEKCVKAGLEKCRVQYLRIPDNINHEQSGQLTLRFAPDLAERYVFDITSEPADQSFVRSDRNDHPNSGEYSLKEQNLERELLLIHQKKLRSMEGVTDNEIKFSVGRRLSLIDQRIREIDEKIALLSNEFGVHEVTINYNDSRYQGHGGGIRPLPWINVFDMAIYGLVGSVTVALMTMLYLGTIGFSFLGLRRLAQKVGLIKGGPKSPIADGPNSP
jgi:hypothetical protein